MYQLFFFLLGICVGVGICTCGHMAFRGREVLDCSGVEVIHCCEPPDLGDENGMLILYQSSSCSQPWQHLCRPLLLAVFHTMVMENTLGIPLSGAQGFPCLPSVATPVPFPFHQWITPTLIVLRLSEDFQPSQQH